MFTQAARRSRWSSHSPQRARRRHTRSKRSSIGRASVSSQRRSTLMTCSRERSTVRLLTPAISSTKSSRVGRERGRLRKETHGADGRCMFLPLVSARLPEWLGTCWIGFRRGWSPVDRLVLLSIERSDDHCWAGVERSGTVRAWDPANGNLLLLLAHPLARSNGEAFDVVAATPALRDHNPPRLLVTWTAVRIVRVSSFRDISGRETIGTGRLVMRCARRTIGPLMLRESTAPAAKVTTARSPEAE
jgi:hypothetical protein